MPTYEYICDACGYEFEKFHSMSAAPIKVCPECAKKKVRRKIGIGAGLIFKGSGFYITDYRSDGYNESAKKDAAPTTSESAGSATKPTDGKSTDGKSSESKPAEAKSAESKSTSPTPESAPKPNKPEKQVAKSSSAKSRKR